MTSRWSRVLSKDECDVVVAAVKDCGQAIAYANPRYLGDREIAMLTPGFALATGL